MIRYELRPETGQAAVTFTVRADEFAGQPLAVVGDFNDWNPAAQVMDAEGADPVWTATLSLAVGHRYAFRYLTGDGTWLNDDAPHGWDDNGMGGQNSVLDLRAEGDGSEEPPVPGVDEPTPSMAPGDGTPLVSGLAAQAGRATSAKAPRVKKAR